jgi:hypothetical protein
MMNFQGKKFDSAALLALQVNGYGAYLNTTAVNAFRVLAGSGNLASGTVRVYGIAK